MVSEENTLCLFDLSTKSEVKISSVVLADFFSNRERKITLGKEKFKYFDETLWKNNGKVDFDLLDKNHKPKTEPQTQQRNKSLNYILEFLILRGQQMKKSDLNKVLNGANVVCCRGLITKIASSPYAKYEKDGFGFKCQVQKFGNVLFLMEMNTDSKLNQVLTDEEKEDNYCGLNFERHVFEKSKEEDSDGGKMFSACLTTFEADSKTNEKKLKLFQIGEIDGLNGQEKHVEVKLQEKPVDSKLEDLFKETSFQQKAMKWWIQSTFGNMDNIVVGYTCKSLPNVRKAYQIKKIELKYLDEKCKNWNKNVCLLATQHFFNQLQEKFDKLVKSGEVLTLERKRNSTRVTYSIEETDILNNDFRKYYSNS